MDNFLHRSPLTLARQIKMPPRPHPGFRILALAQLCRMGKTHSWRICFGDLQHTHVLWIFRIAIVADGTPYIRISCREFHLFAPSYSKQICTVRRHAHPSSDSSGSRGMTTPRERAVRFTARVLNGNTSTVKASGGYPNARTKSRATFTAWLAG